MIYVLLVAGFLMAALYWGEEKPLAARYEEALQALQSGNLAPMKTLAELSVGDAWFALAKAYGEGAAVNRDDEEATAAFRKAMECRVWIDNHSTVCATEYDRRRFLGIGAKLDYRQLMLEWEGHYFPGYGRETELAWIRSCGPTELRNDEKAWHWLSLRNERWGDRTRPALPSSSYDEIRCHLEEMISLSNRQEIEAEAKWQVHREFVEGK